MKIVKQFQLKMYFFGREKSLYIAWTCFRNGNDVPICEEVLA